MSKIDYFALINAKKQEKKTLLDKADALIEQNSIGTELEDLQNKIKTLGGEIDLLENQAAASAQDADPEPEPNKGAPAAQNGEPKKLFNSLGEQLKAVRDAKVEKVVDNRLLEINNAIQGGNTQTGSEGAFLLQEDFAGAILRSAAETGSILSRVDTYTVNGNANTVRWVDIDESDISEHVFGGVKMYFMNEGQTVPPSHPKLKERTLELRKLGGFAYATEELLQDTAFMSSLYARSFTVTAQRIIEDNIINGDGVAKPLGILNSPALVSTPVEAGQEAGTITADNILKMRVRMMTRNAHNMVWLIHPDMAEQLPRLKLGDNLLWMPAGGLRDTMFESLLGRPVVYVDYCAPLGSKGDIILCDLNEYMLIRKGGIRQDWSMHVEFLTDQMCFRIIMRFNGTPKVRNTLKIKNSPILRSPFVTLDARV